MSGRGSGFSGGHDVIAVLPIATLAECRLCLVALLEYNAITRNRYVWPDTQNTHTDAFFSEFSVSKSSSYNYSQRIALTSKYDPDSYKVPTKMLLKLLYEQ